jgi:hypothetical protein
MERASLQRTDYRTLQDLARSANFKVVEAKGLDNRNGVRFHKEGVEWIAVNSDLPAREKVRVLGYLMLNGPGDIAAKLGRSWSSTCNEGFSCALTLCC